MNTYRLLITVVLFACAGCTMTARQIDAREYRRTDFKEQFRAERRHCVARGGRIYINASRKVGRDGIPGRGDYYFCA